nr:hypothetical protein [Tanacetum cinerariifolium]
QPHGARAAVFAQGVGRARHGAGGAGRCDGRAWRRRERRQPRLRCLWRAHRHAGLDRRGQQPEQGAGRRAALRPERERGPRPRDPASLQP